MATDASKFSSISAVPVTVDRPVPENLDQVIKNPGAPRANVTVDAEHPHGAYKPPSNMTVLQQHFAFFDPDNDGVIWPADTYFGFRALGFNPLLCVLAILVIHGTFSYWSGDSWLPHPGFPIYLRNAHKTKHGSDSETFDTEGRFVPEKFEEAFSKYGGKKNALTLEEINHMVKGNANIMDPTGWVAEWLEWNVSYYLAAKDTPNYGKILTKDDARGIIDGTLFYKMAKDIKEGRLKRTSMFKAGLSQVSHSHQKNLSKPSKKAEHDGTRGAARKEE